MKPLTILFLLFSLGVLGQQPEYPDSGFTNKAEARNLTVNGLKEGKWIEKIGIGTTFTKATGDIANDSVYYLTVYKKGKPVGIQRDYRMNGKLLDVKPYTNGLENGVERGYYENGTIESESPYSSGKKNGMQKIYFENGTLRCEVLATDGKYNGVMKSYYKSGKLSSEYNYSNGKLVGMQREYYENGKTKTEITFKDDKPETMKHFDENGNEIKQ